MNILPREFYLQDTSIVAKNLLGKKIVHKIEGHTMSGIITETEAYGYKEDPASHAFKKMTERNKAMFGPVGHAYVYFTYGMHYCFNVVAKNPKTNAGAVLIRGIEPTEGIKKMLKNRNKLNLKNLTNGPAKLSQALQITKKQYGEDLTKENNLYITDENYIQMKIISSPRIGIREATDKLWNFKFEYKKRSIFS